MEGDSSNRPVAAEGEPVRRQAGCIPYRGVGDGSVEILVISSTAGYWLVPKGHIEPGQTTAEAAAAEAWEEAGVRGELDQEPVGVFEYAKLPSYGPPVRCEVTVFGLRVTEVAEAWPESEFRDRRWVDAESAARLVRWDGLRPLIRRFTRRPASSA